MKRSAAPVLFAALALSVIGVISHAKPSHSLARAIRPNLLIGAWVLKGDPCEGDSGVIYKRNGTWTTYDLSGSWKLSGDRLTRYASARGGPDEPSRRVILPERDVSTILSLSSERLIERWSDKSLHTFTRCR
jgi:hypothetical protein